MQSVVLRASVLEQNECPGDDMGCVEVDEKLSE